MYINKILLIATIFLAGCASTYVIPIGEDTYKIARHAPAFYWGKPYVTEKIVFKLAA